MNKTRSCKYSKDAPHDVRKYRSKHVEQSRNNKLSYTFASCWSFCLKKSITFFLQSSSIKKNPSDWGMVLGLYMDQDFVHIPYFRISNFDLKIVVSIVRASLEEGGHFYLLRIRSSDRSLACSRVSSPECVIYCFFFQI